MRRVSLGRNAFGNNKIRGMTGRGCRRKGGIYENRSRLLSRAVGSVPLGKRRCDDEGCGREGGAHGRVCLEPSGASRGKIRLFLAG